ncbi:hypothetical protein QPX48_01680 [Corynebacterium accolens]|uniref:Major facilitator superfamily permease n=1 Tax=Corynebacterium segmentosum TaxID=43990 RepID=A0ABY6TCV3_9CORY|nr:MULTISPECIES: hypothetical protein [Corynebacterium]EEI15423.1 hypothetical protein HMPREF0276_0038 [Corynebacterium accolens ATCC 49725]MDK4310501.1 hypothetical protein [Corynebacterium accolens]UQZ27510.1 putative transporter [Corynebacterium accolens]VEH72447.1 major facilitator superfamily permease [Corynebacterium segmentosum]
MGVLVFAIIEGPDLGWWEPQSSFSIFGWTWSENAAISPVPLASAISAVGFVLFIRWEKHRERRHRSALLDLELFSYSTFSWGNITAGAVAIGEFAIIFVLPLYLINALDLSTMLAGLVLAAMAIGAFFSGAAARRVAARYGAPGAVVQALSEDMANAAQWSLVAATAFFVLSFCRCT